MKRKILCGGIGGVIRFEPELSTWEDLMTSGEQVDFSGRSRITRHVSSQS